MIESMSALIRSGAVDFADAKAAVVESPVWADQRELISTNRWVDAPELPDPDAVDRLQQACHELPRIAEAWVTGSEMTRHDGSSSVSTAIAVVLDPPLTAGRLDQGELAATTEIITRLEAAWSPAGRCSWLWMTKITAREKEHCVAIYSRPS